MLCCFLFPGEQVSVFMLWLELCLHSSVEAPPLLSATLRSPSELKGGMTEGKGAHVCPRPWKRAKVKYSSNALCCETALLLVLPPQLEHTQQLQHTHPCCSCVFSHELQHKRDFDFITFLEFVWDTSSNAAVSFLCSSSSSFLCSSSSHL